MAKKAEIRKRDYERLLAAGYSSKDAYRLRDLSQKKLTDLFTLKIIPEKSSKKSETARIASERKKKGYPRLFRGQYKMPGGYNKNTDFVRWYDQPFNYIVQYQTEDGATHLITIQSAVELDNDSDDLIFEEMFTGEGMNGLYMSDSDPRHKTIIPESMVVLERIYNAEAHRLYLESDYTTNLASPPGWKSTYDDKGKMTYKGTKDRNADRIKRKKNKKQ